MTPNDIATSSTSKPESIPKALAETVAESVSATFSINDKFIRRTPEPVITKDEIEMFNTMMGEG